MSDETSTAKGKVFKVTDEIPDTLEDIDYPLLTLEEQLNPVDFELLKPIKLNGVETSVITLKPPTAKMVMQAQTRKREVEAAFEHLSNYCSCAPSDLYDLHPRDFKRLVTVTTAFSL